MISCPICRESLDLRADPIYRDDDPRAIPGIGYTANSVVIHVPLAPGKSRYARIALGLLLSPVVFCVGGFICAMSYLMDAQQKPYLYKTKDLK